jgi:putative ABC transport system permease protein
MSLALVLAAAWRESRGSRGRILFFTLCLALGSMGVVGVAGLADAVRVGLAAQSREMLGADVWIRSHSPLPEELGAEIERASDGSARLAGVRLVSTMVRAADAAPAGAAPSPRSVLAELKAVDPGFPFRGAIELDPPGPLDLALADRGAAVARELAATLGLRVGDAIAIGNARLTVRALVLDEPGRLDPTFTLGPRVFAALADFPAMGLEGFGSRVLHGALVALPEERDLGAFVRTLRRGTAEVEDLRIDSHEETQPQVRRTVGRIEQYLGLVALLSLVLGGIGVAQIARAWVAARQTSIAILRVLGFTPREVLVMYAGHVVLIALLGSLAGAVAGSLLPLCVPAFLSELLPAGVRIAWEPGPIGRGVLLGTGIALAFSLPVLVGLRRVPPARVLRHEAEPLPPSRPLAIAAGIVLLAAVFLAALVQSGASDQAAWFTAGAALLFGLLALGAHSLMQLARAMPRARLAPGLVHGIAALARPGAGVLGAVSALGLGALVVVTMLLVESGLAERLGAALPADAPTAFFLDVQPDQRAGVEALLAREGASSVRSVPVVTARLSSIDGTSVESLAPAYDRREDRERGERRSRDSERAGDRDSSRSGRGRWALRREQRLTWQQELTPDNRVVAGALWSDPEHMELSLEREYADDIGVTLGSRLVFDVQGVPFELVVTSLREVDWESFGINFFLVVEPGVLDRAPHAVLAAARLPREAETAVQDALVAAFPNVSVIQVRPILEKVLSVLERGAATVQVLGGFTVLVGLAILAAVASLSALARVRETALLKTLGVTRGGVARLYAVEFALVGLVAGVVGALGACVLAWAFFEHVLDLGSAIPWWTVPAAGLVSAALAALAGLAGSARSLAARPIESLRG